MFTPLLDVLILFTITTPAISLLDRRIGRRMGLSRLVELYALLGLVSALMTIPTLHYEVSEKGVLLVTWGSPPDLPMEACLEIDGLSVFMMMVFLLVGLLTLAYSITFMEHDSGLFGYYTLFLGIITGMVGVVSSGDLFTLFIFWEVMCVCSYALVAFRKGQWEPVEAGYKYLIMSGAGSLTILFAISLLYGLTGTLNIAYLSQSLTESSKGVWTYLPLALIVAGFGLQAGMAPLHTWLPDAHSAAPSPVSAVLSGTMVKTGIYGLIRVLILVFAPLQGAWRMMLAVFAVLTMFTGNLMALMQDDLKRLLAFSTVANVGYIIFGVATGIPSGLTGGLFQVLNHATVKALLFLCAGSFYHQTETRSLKELEGVGRRMPITSLLFVVGVVGLAGIPPLNMFWSEWAIMTGGVEAGMFIFSALMMVNLALSAVYCLRLIQTIILKNETSASSKAAEVSLPLLVPTLVLGILCVVIGLYPGPFRHEAERAAKAALRI